MRFNLTKEFIDQTKAAIAANDSDWLKINVLELHFADIAEVLHPLTNDEAKFVYFLMDEDQQAEVLMELEEDVRDRFLASLSSQEIATQLENLDSDDAADILGELSDKKVQEVISLMQDDEAADDIVDLLKYKDGTAGSLMQKEFIKARVNWPIDRALLELRRQAEDVKRVYSIYVVDDADRLLGVLSLKEMLYSKPKTKIADIFQDKNIISVKTNEVTEVVSKTMDKYGLVAVPVVDLQNKLVGRITIDDIVEYIKEEADKDFQLATGISEKVEHTSSVWKISRARLPWLIIGMLGGTMSAHVISGFEEQISKVTALAFFIPLITAMGGNVGVQSSAIVVQSLAKGSDIFSNIFKKVGKELLVAMLNGILLSTIIYGIGIFFEGSKLAIVVSLSLFTVIIFASIFGVLIPLGLKKLKVDPALAIGPFVTTLNDIVGLFIYFTIGVMLYKF
ncbi:MAG TPA: magnesium transporter [Taishania sp.]|nr:magnesium transporter [Taishania sp.]HNS41571.1 magnesium transporter [Taishania sp.]